MKRKEIDETEERELERLLQISPTLLMRKFKFSFELSKSICDFIGERRLDETWTCVKELLPTHDSEVCVYGKPLKQVTEAFDYYIAIFDVHTGWKDCSSGEFLFVKTWMKLPSNIDKEEKVELSVGEKRL